MTGYRSECLGDGDVMIRGILSWNDGRFTGGQFGKKCCSFDLGNILVWNAVVLIWGTSWYGMELVSLEELEMEYYQIENGVLVRYTGREEMLSVPGGIHTVGEGAFKGCVSLKKVVLPQGLLRIMGDAFKGCRKLEEVVIPDGVTYIGRYAFHRCHALRRVILPPSVEELGECAFLYCDSMEEACLPGVKKMGMEALANGIALEKLTISQELDTHCICDVFTGCGRVREISCAGAGTDVQTYCIPNVVEAAAGAFEVPSLVRLVVCDILERMMELEERTLVRFRVNIKHIEVPEGIEVLAKSSFYDMRGIVDIRLPRSLKHIESRTFRNCIGLEEVTFGGCDVRIDEDAFRNCTSLKSVRTCDGAVYTFYGLNDIYRTGAGESGIGNETAKAGHTDFGGNERNVSYEAWRGELVAVSAVPALVRAVHKQVLGNFRVSGTILLQYLGAESRVVIPEGITRIAEEAFAGIETIDRVILPESLQAIGAEAFRGCLLMQSIVMPKGLCKIGDGAFRDCVKLLRIEIPARVSALENRVFCHCKALQDVQLPEGLCRIGESAFYGCAGLKKIQLPEGLGFIGKMAFYKSGLKEVRIPAAAEIVQSLAFAKSSLQKVWIAGGRETGKQYGTDVFGGCVRLKALVLEEGVCHIPDKLVYGCTALGRIVLPESIVSVGRHVLEGTKFLAQWKQCMADRMGSILETPSGNDPSCIDETGEVCTSESELSKPQCQSERLQVGEIYTPGSELSKPQCQSERLQVGGTYTPESELSKPQCQSERLQAGERHTSGSEPSRVYCQSGSLQAGEIYTSGSEPSAVFWDGQQFAGEVWIPGNVRIIAGGAFYGNTNITAVHLPDSVQSVGAAAFKGCGQLRQVWMPSAITHLEDEVFSGCVGLEEVLLTQGSGEQTFSDRAELEEVLLTQGLEDHAFSGCAELEEVLSLQKSEGRVAEGEDAVVKRAEHVRIPRWRSIGERAFYRCGKLREVCLEQVEELGREALCGCAALIPGAVNPALRVGEGAFTDTLLGEQLENGLHIVGNLVVSGVLCAGGVILPANVQGIAPYAFAGNRVVSKIVFPEKVCWIGEGAFFGCSGLQSIVWPDGCVFSDDGFSEPECRRAGNGRLKIDASAFEKCISLKEVVCPAQQVGESAFAGCVSLIRAELSRVKVLEKRLFAGCVCLESCCFESAEVVREFCFSGCKRLQDFDLSSMKQIGAYAFDGCESLKNAEFQDGALLMAHALEDCCGLESICLSGQRGEILLKEYALSGCTSLRHIRYMEKEWAFGCYTDILSQEIPEMVRLLFHSAFSCFTIEQEENLVRYRGAARVVRIPAGIRRIAQEVFRDAMMLEQVEIPESVTYIGARAFHGTPWLADRRKKSPLVVVRDMLLDGSACVGDVIIPPDIRLVCGWAFANGLDITGICFSAVGDKGENAEPDSLSEMVQSSSCENAEPDTPAEMIRDNCVEKAESDTPSEMVRDNCVEKAGSDTPSEMVRGSRFRYVQVEEYAFRNCINLRKITLPDRKTIFFTGLADRERALPPLAKQAVTDSLNCFKTDGNGVLMECTGNISRLRLADGITAIGEGAFQDGNLLTTVTFSKTVAKIGARAFAGCKWLREVRQADGVAYIGAHAFSGCGLLRSVELSENLRAIGTRAFENCTALEEILIPEGVEEIPERAFYRCHSLKMVRLPSTLKTIGREAYAFCRGVSGIQVPAGVQVGERAFYGCKEVIGNFER